MDKRQRRVMGQFVTCVQLYIVEKISHSAPSNLDSWYIFSLLQWIRSTRNVAFTDHVANPIITRETALTSSSTDNLNLRLTRASTYLFQFNLDVRYRSGKQHVIPDALSRLSAASNSEFFLALKALNLNLYHTGVEDLNLEEVIYNGLLLTMSPAFKKKFIDGY